MAPIAELAINKVWEAAEDIVVMDCLLPTGIIVQLRALKDAPLSEVKNDLWTEAQRYPLYRLLKGKGVYMFTCITDLGEKAELSDETKTLRDIKPFAQFLKLEEMKGDKDEKIANAHISMLIGRGLHDFDKIQNPEASDFRKNSREKCERIAKERETWTWEKRVGYLYPSEISETVELPKDAKVSERRVNTRTQETEPVIRVQVTWTDSENPDIRKIEELLIPASMQPRGVIDKTLNARCLTTGEVGIPEQFVLKVCGRCECLLGNYPLSQYTYVRRCVMRGTIPRLVMTDRSDILEDNPPALPPKTDRYSVMPPQPVRQQGGRGQAYDTWSKMTLSYDVPTSFSITVQKVDHVYAENQSKIQVRACLYHGPESMCDVLNTVPATLKDYCASWSQDLVFEDLKVQNMPRMARLCFMVYKNTDRRKRREVTGGGRQRHEFIAPLAWGNTTVFDYKGRLRTGQRKMYLWPVADDDILTEEGLNPIGTVEANPPNESAMCLTINICDFNQAPNTFISFPPLDKVLEMAASNTSLCPRTGRGKDRKNSVVMLDDSLPPQRAQLDQLEQMLRRSPMQELLEQERDQIWRLRYECLHYFPWSLPRLLRCVNWNKYVDVAQMYALLQAWPMDKAKPEEALELLDFAYADCNVRSYAVKCIRKFSDSDLIQYLLHLVQVLKYESYHECELVDFLLERALVNRQIGHHLFWLLRSEMHVASISVRFGLILEAYLRGSPDHIKTLEKQVLALDKFKYISSTLAKPENRSERPDNKSDKVANHAINRLSEELKSLLAKFNDSLDSLQMTFDPRYIGKAIQPENCKVMDSKMKPLWLAYVNSDRCCPEEIFFMYKNGDDLRQDMLTLQVLRIINRTWEEAGKDLRLFPYQCLSTGQKEGYIEVVTHAKTLASIQKKYNEGSTLTSPFNKQCIYKYLKENNNTKESLDDALDTFTRSCAGYCVAMYVLGVADRHGDNIMLRTDGQLLHIDFGHFMGNWKKWKGINKDICPMYLPADVVYALKAYTPDKEDNFHRFQKLCEEGYLELRKKCNFLMTLFLMMVNTGLPELSRESDVLHLRDTLLPEKTEKEALLHFTEKIKDSLKSAWKMMLFVSLPHNMARN